MPPTTKFEEKKGDGEREKRLKCYFTWGMGKENAPPPHTRLDLHPTVPDFGIRPLNL